MVVSAPGWEPMAQDRLTSPSIETMAKGSRFCVKEE